MIQARPAAVRPRVMANKSTVPALLEDVVAEALADGRTSLLLILGGPGMGKTTALADVASRFESRVAVDDAAGAIILRDDPDRNHAVCTLTPWTRDDLMEYLLARHRSKCAAVLARLADDNDLAWLDGVPALCAPVLDLMAKNDRPPNAKAALARFISEAWPTEQHAWFRQQCHKAFTDGRAMDERCLKVLRKIGVVTESQSNLRHLVADLLYDRLAPAGAADDADAAARRSLLKHWPVALGLAADGFIDELEQAMPEAPTAWCTPWLDEVAARVRDRPSAVKTLSALLASKAQAWQSVAASILHRVEPESLPALLSHRKYLFGKDVAGPNLVHASLAAAKWSRIDLRKAVLRLACFDDADLTAANLSNASAQDARFRRAQFSQAQLRGLVATYSDFSNADLSNVYATDANFNDCNLTGTQWDDARLAGAYSARADLTGATFARAYVFGAMFEGAIINDADFTRAKMNGAVLAGLDLRCANIARVDFTDADLRKVNMEGMDLTGCAFERAKLIRAQLTGSRCRGGNFQYASLVQAELADLDWEGADLQHPDLRGASFHMGSSRSGLVHSPIASEGSRTGFYTDDYCDQTHVPPEEIRKANLRNADLRGANLEGVDFYLVDLRGAKLDANARDLAKESGAILDDWGHP